MEARASKRLYLGPPEHSSPVLARTQLRSPSSNAQSQSSLNESMEQRMRQIPKKSSSWKMTAEKCQVIKEFNPEKYFTSNTHLKQMGSDRGSKDLEKYLPLNIGDIVAVIAKTENGSQGDDDWWAGALGERIGRFPAKYVLLIQEGDARKPSSLSVSSLRSSGWLNLNVDEIVVQAIEEPKEKPTVPPRPAFFKSSKDGREEESLGFKRFCTAKWGFASEKEGELSFAKGAVIEILEKRPDSWWKGRLEGLVGNFPANFVTEDVDEEPIGDGYEVDEDGGWIVPGSEFSNYIDKLGAENKRTQLLNEIVLSEWDYILDLQNIMQVFVEPLQAANIIPTSDMASLFSNLPLILTVCREFYNALSRRVRRYSTVAAADNSLCLPVGDVFDRMAGYSCIYVTYCRNHRKAMETQAKLEQKDQNFNRFLKFCRYDPACQGLELNDLLIKPVNRLEKYPDYLEELLRYTPEDHEDHPFLKGALVKLRDVVVQVEKEKKQRDMTEQLFKIQSYFGHKENLIQSRSREFLKQGVVTIHNPYQKYKSMRVVMFLLSDIILFGKPKSEEFLEECNRRKNCFTLHTKVPLHQTRLIDIFAEDWANSFELQHIQKSKSKARCFLISAESAEDKKDWILKLKELIRKYQLQRIESDRAIDVGRKEKNRIRWSRKEKKEKREKKLKKSGGEKEKGGSPKEIDDEYIQSVMRARSSSTVVVDIHDHITRGGEQEKGDKSPKEDSSGEENTQEESRKRQKNALYFSDVTPWSYQPISPNTVQHAATTMGNQRIHHVSNLEDNNKKLN